MESKRKKIISIFGTRPEAIKMAPLIKKLENDPHFTSVVVVTAQHREMLDQVLHTFNILPDYDLDIMEKGQTLTEITNHVLSKLEKILKLENPDLVLVHGDTTTSFAAALASFYQKIPIGHIEAGLRTHDKYSPFPEEGNRQLTDILSDIYFTPTEKSRENLIKEGHKDENIFVTGNTAIDALFSILKFPFHHNLLDDLKDKRIILLTMHRRENIGDPMIRVFKGIKKITSRYPDAAVVFPMHANPVIQDLARKELGNISNIYLVEPMEVSTFQHFLKKSFLVISDSGGVQEEAPALNIPLLVLRQETERPEGVLSGSIKLIGTDSNVVFEEVCQLFDNPELYKRMAFSMNPYGDGRASERILEAISYYFQITATLPKKFHN